MPSHWSDVIHDFDGHGFGVEGADRTGENILLQEVISLYVQNGMEAAAADVSGPWLDPAMVREGLGVEMKFFADVGVYEYVP